MPRSAVIRLFNYTWFSISGAAFRPPTTVAEGTMNVWVSPQWMRYDAQQTRFHNRTKQMESVNITRGHISRRHFLQAFSLFAANTALASGADIQRSNAGARANDSVEYGRSTPSARRAFPTR
jgi:hypothetical protein